jgi:hypothetical protein
MVVKLAAWWQSLIVTTGFVIETWYID